MEHQVFRIDKGDPNGKIIAQSPAICYTDKGGFWIKINDVKDFNFWKCVIADQP